MRVFKKIAVAVLFIKDVLTASFKRGETQVNFTRATTNVIFNDSKPCRG